MAAIAAPWAKPGAWALDSEENEAELLQQQQQQSNPSANASAAEFPSLSAAAATKTSKKKSRGQTMSLAELASYKPASSYKPPSQSARGLTHEDLLALPTGPRERTAEELDRSRIGGGFRSYGPGRYGDESGNDRRGGFDESRTREPLPPSRADEIDDWGAAKKQLGAAGNGFDRRERGERGSSGFFNSNSKADESDNWASSKSMETHRFSSENSEFGRERRGFRGGFEGMSNGGGADSDRWGRKPQYEVVADSDRWSRKTQGEGGADTDRWSRKPQDEGTLVNPSRPKLVLQPRTVPVGEGSSGSPTLKPKGSSPFGNARPREEVLKEKGQDWKEIDEKLENVKIKEEKTEAFGKKDFGSGNGRVSPQEQDGMTERSWRKADTEAAIPSADNVEAEVESDDNPKAEA